MTKYTVHKAIGDSRVIIALADSGPAEGQGFNEVGSFTHGEGDSTLDAPNGDHVFIAKAKEVLRDSGDFDRINLDKLVYLDQASNAPKEENFQLGGGMEELKESGGEPHPEISTQLGGVGSAVNDSELPTTQNSETETVTENQEGSGSENTQERIEGAGEDKQEPEDKPKSEDEDDGKETVDQLKERIALITDKAELEAAYKEEIENKNRVGAITALEARANELNEAG